MRQMDLFKQDDSIVSHVNKTCDETVLSKLEEAAQKSVGSGAFIKEEKSSDKPQQPPKEQTKQKREEIFENVTEVEL